METPQGERLTIAAVCERARCTPPTLYHHFGDLASLERAASRRAFVSWSKDVDAGCADIEDPKERLAARGQSYLDWAAQHPDAYTALFSLPRKADDPNAATLEGAGFQALVQNLADIHELPPADPSIMPLAFAYWAGAHGLASLSISVPHFTEKILTTSLDIMTESLIGHGPVDPPSWASDLSILQKRERRELPQAS